MDELVDEFVKTVEFAHASYPELPIFGMGHSLGGLQVIVAVLKNYSRLQELNLRGVISECSWLTQSANRPIGRFERIVLSAMSWIAPRVTMAAGIDLFSDDLEQNWVRMCRESPLMGTTMTPRLAVSTGTGQTYAWSHAADWPVDLPLLFLQGEADPLTRAPENLEWGRSIAAREGTKVIVKAYPSGTHYLFKIPIRGQVLRDVFEFIDANTA
jgi:alpha-beta hydrolase superfamily lysophospholipase